MPNSSALIDAFCDQVWLQDGLAASSLGSYRRDLMAWARWLEDAKSRKSLLAANRGDIEAFLAAQFQTGAKSSSINRRLSSLRRFYRLQLLLGTLKDDPTLRIQSPKLPRHLPKNLSEAQISALLEAPDPETTRTGDRAAESLRDGPRVQLVGLTLAISLTWASSAFGGAKGALVPG
jgi:integrase/recombinase XerD